MKGDHLHRWRPLGGDGQVHWMKYSFGPGTANSLAVKLADESWLVISPATGMPDAAYNVLEDAGPVTALLAPNPFHNMGQAAWRARFPKASSYAPREAFSRLSAKTPTIDYRPIEELAGRLSGTQVLLPEGMKKPDLIVRVSTAAGNLWWMGDQFSNSESSDQIWLLRAVSRIFGSGPGFRCNSKPELVYVRNRAAWIDSIRSALLEAPPSIVVPAHGNPVTENATERTHRALDAIDLSRKRAA